YKGEIYPINPKAQSIEGIRTYKNIKEIPHSVDLAIVCVNADLVEQCLIESGECNVKSTIIFASGYSEIGEQGIKAQEKLKEIADRYSLKIIGPRSEERRVGQR